MTTHLLQLLLHDTAQTCILPATMVAMGMTRGLPKGQMVLLAVAHGGPVARYWRLVLLVLMVAAPCVPEPPPPPPARPS